MFKIENRDQEIVSTAYWETPHAAKGLLYLSWNAGAGRLLVPDGVQAMLPAMRDAPYVIVSRGPWMDQGGRDALELLCEDGSDEPFCLYLVAEQTDRLLPDSEQGGGFVIAVWTREGEQLRLPGKYRRVATLPCLDPWSEQ